MTRRALRWLVLAVAALYFFGPLLLTLVFTVHAPGQHGIGFGAYAEIFHNSGVGQVSFVSSLLFSLLLAAVTIALTLALMVPTQILLHVSLPRVRPVVEVVCLLPLVFPPVVLVVGVNSVFAATAPTTASGHGSALFRALAWIKDEHHPLLLVVLYAVMSLPYVYRTIDAGIRALDVRTLTEASRSLGASWWTTIVHVLVAGLRTSLVNAGFLVFALVMGEFTVSSMLLYTKPFAVWLALVPSSSGQVQAAVSVLGLVIVEAALLVLSVGLAARGRSRRTLAAAVAASPTMEVVEA